MRGEKKDLLAAWSQADSKNISVHFSKMHGLGNDFVMMSSDELARLVAAGQAALGETGIDGPWLRSFCSKLASTLCDRHFGIGGDGLIVAIDLARLAKEIAATAEGDRAENKKAQQKEGPNKDRRASGNKGSFYLALDQLTAGYPDRDSCELAWMYINSDGSPSAMCGNGLRCFTLFVHELGWLNKANGSVATAAYPVGVTIKDYAATGAGTTAGGGPVGGNTALQSIEVVTRLAGPKFSPEDIPLNPAFIAAGLKTFVDQTIDVNGLKLLVTCVSMGNPHCIVFEQDNLSMARYAADIQQAHGAGRALQNFPPELLLLAADIQKLSLFPEGVNVEFVKIDQKAQDVAIVFVVERGCGATLACASGAAAVLAAGVKSGRLNKKSYVILPGGKLEVSLSSVNEEAHAPGSMKVSMTESGTKSMPETMSKSVPNSAPQSARQYAPQSTSQSTKEYIDLTGSAVKAFSGEVTVVVPALLAAMALDTGTGSACQSPPSTSAKSSPKSSAKFGEGLCV